MVHSILDRMNSGDLFPLVITTVAISAGIIIVLSKLLITSWRGLRERQMASQLIHELLAQNMTSDEIVQVMTVYNGKTGGKAFRDAISNRHMAANTSTAPRKPPKNQYHAVT